MDVKVVIIPWDVDTRWNSTYRLLKKIIHLRPALDRALSRSQKGQQYFYNKASENDENRPLKDFAAPKAIGIQLGYTVPNVAANNFELKPALLNMLSQHMFNGLAHEDLNQYLAMFEELRNTVKINGVEPEAIKLRAFPFSLGDKARNWLTSLDTGTIRT
jgi:hypothetical protein